jgi:hypothetical protein
MGKVLHASGSGYFIGCIKEQNELVNCFSGNLTQLMALFWRVKRWEATATGTLERDSGDQLQSITFDNVTRELQPSPPIPSAEEDLVCFNSEAKSTLIYFTTAAWATDQNGNPVTDTLGFTVSSGYRADDQYYFGVEKTGNNFRIAGLALFGPTFLINGNGNTPPIYSAPLVEAGDYVINTSVGSITGKLWTAFTSIPATCVVIINAKEYWSYGGTYNTSTGELL